MRESLRPTLPLRPHSRWASSTAGEDGVRRKDREERDDQPRPQCGIAQEVARVPQRRDPMMMKRCFHDVAKRPRTRGAMATVSRARPDRSLTDRHALAGARWRGARPVGRSTRVRQAGSVGTTRAAASAAHAYRSRSARPAHRPHRHACRSRSPTAPARPPRAECRPGRAPTRRSAAPPPLSTRARLRPGRSHARPRGSPAVRGVHGRQRR